MTQVHPWSDGVFKSRIAASKKGRALYNTTGKARIGREAHKYFVLLCHASIQGHRKHHHLHHADTGDGELFDRFLTLTLALRVVFR